MMACAVLGTVSVVVFPKVTQWVIDEIHPGGHPERLGPLALLALGAFFVQQVLNAARIYINNVFEQKVIFDLRSDLYSHIQRLPLGWFDNRATGDLMTRILEDVNAVERVLIDGIEQGVIAVLQIIVVIVMLLRYSAWLTLVALSPLPFLIAGALAYTLTAHTRYKQQRVASSAMNSLLHDNLAGIRQIKTYVREDEEHRRFNAVSDQLREATLVIMRTWSAYNPAMNFFTNAGLALVLFFGAGPCWRDASTRACSRRCCCWWGSSMSRSASSIISTNSCRPGARRATACSRSSTPRRKPPTNGPSWSRAAKQRQGSRAT